MKVIDIIEARSKPGMNPKVSAYEQLLKYKDDPTIFISFTVINKAGLNPRSSYNTPNGIYTYPLAKTWEMYNVDEHRNFSRYPFANNNPYIQILKATKPEAILDVDQYTEEQYQHDLKKIMELYPYDEKKIIRAIGNAHVNTPAGKIWAATRKATLNFEDDHDNDYDSIDDDEDFVAPEFEPDDSDSIYNTKSVNEAIPGKVGNASANQWSTLLRKLGYGLIIDLGHSIIHSSEPCQAVFLGTKYFKHLGVALNRREQESTKKTQYFQFDKLQDLTTAGSPEDQQKISKYLAQNMPTEQMVRYCALVLKGRWPAAEPRIMKDPRAAIPYIQHILSNGTYPFPRWEQAEPYIVKDPKSAITYMSMTGTYLHGSEPYVLKSKDVMDLFSYADNIPDRFVKGEPHMIHLISKIDPITRHRAIRALIKYATQNHLFDWTEMKKLCIEQLFHTPNYYDSELVQFAIKSGKRWPKLERVLNMQGNKADWNTYIRVFPEANHTYQPTPSQ